MFTVGINQEKYSHYIDFYTTIGVAPWWPVERMQL